MHLLRVPSTPPATVQAPKYLTDEFLEKFNVDGFVIIDHFAGDEVAKAAAGKVR